MSAARCRKAKSGECEIGQNYLIVAYDENNKLLPNANFVIEYSDGSKVKAVSDSNGKIELKDCIPGSVINLTEKNENGILEV